MNKKTIRDLYFGHVCPAELRDFENETYKSHMKEFDRLYGNIEALLSEESRENLTTMMEEYGEAHDEVIIDAFVKGFQLGMSLTAEGLSLKEE